MMLHRGTLHGQYHPNPQNDAPTTLHTALLHPQPQGGKEAARSNAILHAIITDALAQVTPTVGGDLISLVTSREGVDELLALHDVIDLVIPRGSNALVSHIQNNTKIPVLGHADGICHIYVDEASDIEQAVRICVDAKVCGCVVWHVCWDGRPCEQVLFTPCQHCV